MKITILLLFSFVYLVCFSQKTLDVHYYSVFGKEKVFQFFNNELFHYKLKGDLFYKTEKIVNMQDSMLIFKNDFAIPISKIKSIKIKGGKFSSYLFSIGLGFFILDSGNNIFQQKPFIVSETAGTVLALSIISGLIVKRIQDKHLRIRKNCTLRIIESNYQNLYENKLEIKN